MSEGERPASTPMMWVALMVGMAFSILAVTMPSYRWKGLAWLCVAAMCPPKGVKFSWAQICYLVVLAANTGLP